MLWISIVAAIGKNSELGVDNTLPWHVPADLRSFKKITQNQVLVMGRKTYESLGKPLPLRKHLVISSTVTHDPDYPDVKFFDSIEGCTDYCLDAGIEEVFVIGGSQIFKEYLPIAHCLYLSRIDWSGRADCYFPRFNQDDFVVEEYKSHEQEDDAPAWEFFKLSRKEQPQEAFAFDADEADQVSPL